MLKYFILTISLVIAGHVSAGTTFKDAFADVIQVLEKKSVQDVWSIENQKVCQKLAGHIKTGDDIELLLDATKSGSFGVKGAMAFCILLRSENDATIKHIITFINKHNEHEMIALALVFAEKGKALRIARELLGSRKKRIKASASWIIALYGGKDELEFLKKRIISESDQKIVKQLQRHVDLLKKMCDLDEVSRGKWISQERHFARGILGAPYNRAGRDLGHVARLFKKNSIRFSAEFLSVRMQDSAAVNDGFQLAISLALAQKEPGVLPRLMKLSTATATHLEVKRACWYAISSIGGKESARFLEKSLTPGNANNSTIASSLYRIGDPESIEVLKKLSQKPEFSKSKEAFESIARSMERRLRNKKDKK